MSLAPLPEYAAGHVLKADTWAAAGSGGNAQDCSHKSMLIASITGLAVTFL